MGKGGPSAAVVGAARKRVLTSARSLVARGLVVGSSGNVSERLDANYFVVTPAGVVYDRLRLVDISVVDQRSGACVDGMRPTSELALHLDLYRHDAALKAVVHTHSRHAAAFAVARIDLPFIMNENIAMHAEKILVTDYAPPGSTDLGAQALRTFGRQPGSRAILLANHGVVALGDSVAEAELVAAQVEWIAEVVCLASTLRRDLGETTVLPREMQDAIGRNYGVTFAREIAPKKPVVKMRAVKK
jgi:L-fuculose-phosphate aldolase